MMTILKMAIRDLGRNRRRSFFSSLALGIGLGLLLLMAAFIAGEMRSSMNTTIQLESGHLQVRAKTFNEAKASLVWDDLISDPAAVASQVSQLAPVKAATPRLYANGILSSGQDSQGVRIIGIDPGSAANAPFQAGLLSGEFLKSGDSGGILVGQTLADKLGLKTGDSIQLLANTSNGDVDQQAFTIRGIFSTHTPSYDGSSIFLPLEKAQALTKTQNHASAIFILLQDIDQTDAVTAALQTSQYQVLNYRQMNKLLVEFEQLAGGYIYFFYLIVLAITATVIVNTLIMSVFERTREIGILAAIGMKSSRIMAVFFTESGLLGLGGIVIGLLIGGIFVFLTSTYGFPVDVGKMGITGMLFEDRIYAYLVPNDAIQLTIATFIVALLAAVYPAVLAARMEPVEALHSAQ